MGGGAGGPPRGRDGGRAPVLLRGCGYYMRERCMVSVYRISAIALVRYTCTRATNRRVARRVVPHRSHVTRDDGHAPRRARRWWGLGVCGMYWHTTPRALSRSSCTRA